MAQNIKMPTSADIMSMWNASGLKKKILFTLRNMFLRNKRKMKKAITVSILNY